MQGHLLGYCYRQKIVRETRAQYDQIVLEIQQDNITTWAKETVTWPSSSTLCYPIFNGGTSQANTPLPVSNHTPKQTFSCTVGKEGGEGREGLFQNLPEDRESLIELRSKIGLELIWI